jgi:hypothetical protein
VQWRTDDESPVFERQRAAKLVTASGIAGDELLPLHPGCSVKFKKIDGAAGTSNKTVQRRAHRHPAIVQRQCAAEAITCNGIGRPYFVPLHPGDAVKLEKVHCAPRTSR